MQSLQYIFPNENKTMLFLYCEKESSWQTSAEQCKSMRQLERDSC